MSSQRVPAAARVVSFLVHAPTHPLGQAEGGQAAEASEVPGLLGAVLLTVRTAREEPSYASETVPVSESGSSLQEPCPHLSLCAHLPGARTEADSSVRTESHAVSYSADSVELMGRSYLYHWFFFISFLSTSTET